uniref:Uncharacterized protein n=1 Tax=Anguilla anguilla TaxID=7936 RepID=A0A0E9X5J9_ANGAN
MSLKAKHFFSDILTQQLHKELQVSTITFACLPEASNYSGQTPILSSFKSPFGSAEIVKKPSCV